MLTAGLLGNTTTFPTFITWFSYINPLRYTCQGFFLRFFDHVRPEKLRDSIISHLGFDTFGHLRCLGSIAGIALFYIVLGMIILTIRGRKL